MLGFVQITEFINREINYPSIIIDMNFFVVSYNKKAENIFRGIKTKINISDLEIEEKFRPFFDHKNLINSVNSVGIFVCKNNILDRKIQYVIFSKFVFETGKFYQIVFIDEYFDKEIEIPVFTTQNLEELPLIDELKYLFRETIHNYPFTLITEKEFQHKADLYHLPFWIKSPENEIKLNNAKFSEKFSIERDKLIKREESEILPIRLSSFYESIKDIILRTLTPVFIIRHNFSSQSDVNQDIWLLQYPILGQENKILGIIAAECEIAIQKTEIDCNEKRIEPLTNTEERYSLTPNMLEHFIKILPEPVYVYDSETLNILEANNKAAELYGYKPEEFKTLTVADLYAPENVQVLLEAAKAEFNSKEKIGPVSHQKKDGTLFEVELLNSDILFQGRKAQVNIVQPLEKTKETPGNAKQIDRTIFDDLDEVVIITDINGFITYANDAVTRKLKYEKKYLDNRPFYSLLDEKDWQWLRDIFAQAESKKERFSFETNIKNSEGKLIEARLDGIPIAVSEEEFYAFVVKLANTFTATSGKPERVESNDENTLSIKFLSELFHEILTPVNVILGFTHEIIEGLENPTEEQKESAEIIWQNQKILLQIMDAASQYALLETGRLKLDLRNVGMKKLIDDVVHNLEYYADESAVKLNVSVNDGEITTDVKRVSLILSTAIKLGTAISQTENLFIRGNRSNKNVVISLSDNEGNASVEFLEKLKSVFILNEFTDVQNYGISGIVIRLVKKLAKALNVKFEIGKENDTPASFTVVLPEKLEKSEVKLDLTKEPEQAKEEIPEKERTEEQTVKMQQPDESLSGKELEPRETKQEKVIQPAPGIDIENLSCFYLEDQFDSQLLFKSQMKDLKKIGFAESLQKALPDLIKEKYDFILMDIRLEGDFNGIDALKIVKSLPGYENVPVIAVTAYTEPGDKEKYLSLGFTDYIPKPFLREDVLKSLKRIL